MKAFPPALVLALFALAACDSRPAPAPPAAPPTPSPAPTPPPAAPAAVPGKPAAPAPVVTTPTPAKPAAPAPTAADAAIARFQQGMDAFQQWLRSKEGAASPDMANAGALMQELAAHLREIPTDGLPVALRNAFADYQNSLLAVQKLVATIPASGGSALDKWEKENAEAFGTLNKRMEAAVANLRRAAAQHGLKDLQLGD